MCIKCLDVIPSSWLPCFCSNCWRWRSNLNCRHWIGVCKSGTNTTNKMLGTNVCPFINFLDVGIIMWTSTKINPLTAFLSFRLRFGEWYKEDPFHTFSIWVPWIAFTKSIAAMFNNHFNKQTKNQDRLQWYSQLQVVCLSGVVLNNHFETNSNLLIYRERVSK